MPATPGATPRRTVGKIAADMMHERDVSILLWGDELMVDIGIAAGLKHRHPLKLMRAVAALLKVRPDVFEQMKVAAHDSRGRKRLVNGFRLRRQS